MKIFFVILMLTFFPEAVKAQEKQPPAREVTLEGAFNFRDVGGYATTEYRRVSMGKLYRAGDISNLTDADIEEMKRRKIYTVVDFRSENEIAAAPDKLPPGADYLSLPAGTGNPADFFKEYTSGLEAMTAFYSDVSVFREKYRPFFRKVLLLPDSSAMVFHCSAGKDRTGIAAALLLYALDIPMETILTDYVATNYFNREKNEKMTDWLMNEHDVDRKMAAEILDANPLYLETAFNAIKKQYGSIELFLYREIGIDEAVKSRLREKFLQ